MRRAQFLQQERRLAAEKSIKYRGTASIKLEVLHFPCEDSRERKREPDQANVRRLKKLFQEENGCRRLDLQNHIPAAIDQQQLDAAIQASGISAERLLDDPRDSYPELDFPPGFRLECLHGRHRVLAAAEVLPPGDKRWTVDLYLSDLNHELRTTLIEEYSCEKKPDDGEFYRKIRGYQGYHGESNPYFERRWWARLSAISDHRRECLEQLLRHYPLRAVFDVAVDIPALSGGIRLSVWHKLSGTRCDEEILCYGDYIKEVWYKILRGDRRAMLKVDQATVKALELTAPGASRADAQALYRQLQSGQIFGAFNEQDREAMWSEVLSVSTDRLIPSFFSFFEDLKYLQASADCMKRLIKLSPRDTVFSALERQFSDVNQRADQCVIQESEATYALMPGSLADRVDFGYRQLWMFAMRDYPQMPAETKRKNLLMKPTSGKADETVLQEFATHAYRLGFESEQIHHLRQRSPDREIARNALLKARKPGRYKYDDAIFEDHVEQIMRLFSTAQPVTWERARATSEVDCSKGSPKRCGIPHTRDHEEDRLELFLDKLHNHNEEQCDEITSFFVRRSVYLAYCGKPHHTSTDGSTTYQRTPDPGMRGGETLLPRASSSMDLVDETGNLAEGKLVQERLAREEREKLARAEQERQEQERLGQERLAREEEERLLREEQERLARAEQARLEQERLEREEQERLAREEQERLAREGQERLERERLEQERLNPAGDIASGRKETDTTAPAEANRRRVTQIDFERLAEGEPPGPAQVGIATDTNNAISTSGEKPVNTANPLIRYQASEPQATGVSSVGRPKVTIEFRTFEQKVYKGSHYHVIDPSNPSEVERVVKKYMRKGFKIRDTGNKDLKPQTCFEDVIADGTNTICLHSEWEIDTDKLLICPPTRESNQTTIQSNSGTNPGGGLEGRSEGPREPAHKRNRIEDDRNANEHDELLSDEL